jgi:RNA polymerase sigma-70 factor (ECF subfamily)
MRILMNYCIKENKRRNRQSFVQEPDSGGSEIDPERLSIEMALDHLEPKYKQIIILKYFEDWTIREIAKALHCPDSTIKTWLYKALRGLRSKLQTEGDTGDE